uniref:G-protein coupled receptors family 1 profile domain-containing protein n=1 Tax=Neogobius melanostomus TaxID=47308 RepID=A0A8C6SJK2_9GOBI
MNLDTFSSTIVKNVLVMALGVAINFINGTLIQTFRKHQVFYMNPRYILFIHLVINDIIQLTTSILLYIVLTLNVTLCILLVLLGMAANFNNPMTLAVMALECYIAVCYPLRHSQICTVKKTYIVIVFIWLVSAVYLVPDLFVAWASEPPEFFRSHVVCVRANVLRLPYVRDKDKIFDAVLMAIVWLTLFYAYVRIIFTAKAAATDARKARNTVLLHSFQLLLSMLTYVYYVIFYGLLTFFPNRAQDIRYAITIFINIMPRLVSPLVYGLRDNSFRKYLKHHMFYKLYNFIHNSPIPCMFLKAALMVILLIYYFLFFISIRPTVCTIKPNNLHTNPISL